MKCPFRTKTILTKNIRKTHQFPYDKTEVFFMDCVEEKCMAYDKDNKKCVEINNKC